jgi:hypothetical protein
MGALARHWEKMHERTTELDRVEAEEERLALERRHTRPLPGAGNAAGAGGGEEGEKGEGGGAEGAAGVEESECPLADGTSGACAVGADTTPAADEADIFGLSKRELLIREKTNQLLGKEVWSEKRARMARANATAFLVMLGRISPSPADAGGGAGASGGTAASGGAGGGLAAGLAGASGGAAASGGAGGGYPGGICPTDPPMEWRRTPSPRPRAPSPEYHATAPTYSPIVKDEKP